MTKPNKIPKKTYEVGESVLAVRKVVGPDVGRRSDVRYMIFRFEVVGTNLAAKWKCMEPIGEDLPNPFLGKGYRSYDEARRACLVQCRQRGLRFGAAIKDGGPVRTKAIAVAEALEKFEP